MACLCLDRGLTQEHSIPKSKNYRLRRGLKTRRARQARKTIASSPWEQKYVPNAISQVADSTGAVTLLNGMAPGTAVTQRLGRKVVLTRLEFSLLNASTPTTGLDQVQRIILVVDRQTNGAAPAVLDVLSAGSPTSLFNPDNASRFKILFDSVKTVNASTESDSIVATGRVSVPLRQPVQFNSGTAGTVADMVSGSLYLITLGSIAAGATAGSVSGYTRCYFTDN